MTLAYDINPSFCCSTPDQPTKHEDFTEDFAFLSSAETICYRHPRYEPVATYLTERPSDGA
ncbi:MAG: hypothetical protein AAFN40_15055, partial [Cyanobacteria bacterium J06560_6]